MNSSRRIAGGFLLFGLALGLCGCGGGGEDIPELGTVSGAVTLDGKPLPGVMVVFQPQGAEAGRASMGKTDEQGRYVLTYNTELDGAAVGNHKVRVTTPTEHPTPGFVDPIPAKYNTNTQLTKEVKPGEQTIDLTLKS